MPQRTLSQSVMLATSMHAQPGVYAVLLGSGVSTGAGVPTGWGVVTQLIQRLAAADAPGDAESLQLAADQPERWWSEHHDGELGYSALLSALATTPAARQGLLADFFEPTDEDREQGIKTPSAAHQAIAGLVKRGLVRVIITTNFDRLMEQALDAAGVSPQVISRPEAVRGMAPLAHSQATIIKLHGDYKDLGSRNTPEELEKYPEEWNVLLRQIFDEYGLVISGWSADWDTALVTALESTPNRRYPLYWDNRSSRGENAQRLLSTRAGQIIQAAGSDELFTGLLSSIEALDHLTRPPLTIAMAIAQIKRCLPDPVRRIDLHDLVMDFVEEVVTAITEQPVSIQGLNSVQLEAIYDGHLRAISSLMQLLITGVAHDIDGDHDRLWLDVLQRLVDAGTAPISQGMPALIDARLYPALLALTAMGVTTVRRDRDELLIKLVTRVEGRDRMGTSEDIAVAQLLHPQRILERSRINAFPRWEGTTWIHPASHLLKTDIKPFFEELIPLEADYVQAFHGFEYRFGLVQENINDDTKGLRALSGEYVGERAWSWGDEEVPLAEVAFRKAVERNASRPWNSFLGGTENVDGALLVHREVLKNYRRSW